MAKQPSTISTPSTAPTKTKNPITGIIHVTGESDTGKTIFGLSCGYQPHEIFFVDDDIKSRALLERIAGTPDFLGMFPMYHDFVAETQGQRELAIHALGLDLIEQAIILRPKVIIWDTWSRFAKTCHPFVVKNPHLFREFWSAMGTIKGGEQWQAAFHYEAMIYQKLLKAAPLVILITHLKDDRLNGVKTGKQIPDAQRPLLQKSTMRLFLRHNVQSPAPIGLVLKRIEKWEITPDGLKPIAVLPRRLQPCTWTKIFEYWDNPIASRMPTPEEIPDAFELSILDATLTKDQMAIFKAGLLHPEEEGGVIDIPTVDERVELAKKLNTEGKTKMEIAKAVTEKFGGAKIMPSQVAKWLNSNGGS